MPPPQRYALLTGGRDGNFPSGEDLKDYIAESYASTNGTIQWFDFYCITLYGKLEKAYQDNSTSGIAMVFFVNKLIQTRIQHRQMEMKQYGVRPYVSGSRKSSQRRTYTEPSLSYANAFGTSQGRASQTLNFNLGGLRSTAGR